MSRRRAINVAGLHHGRAPIPAACRLGPLVVTGGISGMDPATGKIATTLDEQVGLIFSNMERVVEAADCSLENIVKCTFFVKDRASRGVIDEEWLRRFPDEASRPARHTLVQELPSPMHVQVEVIAYVADDR